MFRNGAVSRGRPNSRTVSHNSANPLHDPVITARSISASGHRIAAYTRGGIVNVWNADTQASIAQFTVPPDGKPNAQRSANRQWVNIAILPDDRHILLEPFRYRGTGIPG